MGWHWREGELGGEEQRVDWVNSWLPGKQRNRQRNESELMNTGPIKLVFDKIPSLQTTGMTNRGSVMERANNCLVNVEISGDIESSFIECETILDGPVGGKEFLRWRGF